MSASIINELRFIEQIKAQLNKSMIEAAEPIIKEALAKAEAEMRKNMAANLIAFVDRQFDMRVMENRIVIEVRRS